MISIRDPFNKRDVFVPCMFRLGRKGVEELELIAMNCGKGGHTLAWETLLPPYYVIGDTKISSNAACRHNII